MTRVTDKTEQPVSDALIDAYRDILKVKAATAAPASLSITPGAGRAASGKHVPSKRLKAWHRGSGAKQSLKEFARAVTSASVSGDLERAVTARRWFTNKAAQR